MASFEPGGQGFESLRAHFLKILLEPGPRDRKRADRTLGETEAGCVIDGLSWQLPPNLAKREIEDLVFPFRCVAAFIQER